MFWLLVSGGGKKWPERDSTLISKPEFRLIILRSVLWVLPEQHEYVIHVKSSELFTAHGIILTVKNALAFHLLQTGVTLRCWLWDPTSDIPCRLQERCFREKGCVSHIQHCLLTLSPWLMLLVGLGCKWSWFARAPLVTNWHRCTRECFCAHRSFSVPCQSHSLAFLCKLPLFSSGLGLPPAPTALLTCPRQSWRCSESSDRGCCSPRYAPCQKEAGQNLGLMEIVLVSNL